MVIEPEYAGNVDYNLRFSLRTFQNMGRDERINSPRELAEMIQEASKDINDVKCTVTVNCRGRRHTISLVRGRLRLDDHKGKGAIEREHNLMTLGADECRCMEVFRMWKRGRSSDLPETLNKVMQLAKRLSHWRKLLIDKEPKYAPSSHGRPKWLLQIEPLAKRIIRSCDYKIIKDRNAHIITWGGGHKDPHVYGGRILDKWVYPRFGISVRLPAHWNDILKDYNAIILGPKGQRLFVLDVFSFPYGAIKKSWTVALVLTETLHKDYGPSIGLEIVYIRPKMENGMQPDWRRHAEVHEHGLDGLSWNDVLNATRCPV